MRGREARPTPPFAVAKLGRRHYAVNVIPRSEGAWVTGRDHIENATNSFVRDASCADDGMFGSQDSDSSVRVQLF